VLNDPSLRTLLAQVEAQNQNDPHDPLVRQVARLRARDACEYCLHPMTGQFEIDHIIPVALWSNYIVGRLDAAIQPIPARRGPDHLDNFAWSCPFCNLGKRQHVTHRVGDEILRLYDPRHDTWSDHFRFLNNYLFIVGITPIGVATQQALGFNAGEIGGPLGTRPDSIMAGHYPPGWLISSMG
jgi:5-methylcytosine-specific restriction endonuclease McrA